MEEELKKKDEALKVATRDFAGRIKELSKQNANLLRTREDYQRTVAELTKEKNDFEREVLSAKELRGKIGLVLESYFEGVISLSEQELLQALHEKVEDLKKNPYAMKARIRQVGARVVSDLRELGVQLP